MTELKACPICKGTRICMDGGDNTYHPRCLDCGCTAPFDAWQSRTPASPEVERLVDRINDELFCGALKGETKSRPLAALSNTTPYLSGDVKGWLPIETAPKDGTRIMLGYFPDYMDGKQQGGHPQIAWWNDTKNLWCSGLGFLKAKGAFSPTHWMPLPEPPDRKAGE